MKFDWNDVLIVGDSFASLRYQPEDWPMALVLQLTGEEYNSNKIPRGFGFPGGAWWPSEAPRAKESQRQKPKKKLLCFEYYFGG